MHGMNNMEVQVTGSEIVVSVHCSGGTACYMLVSVCVQSDLGVASYTVRSVPPSLPFATKKSFPTRFPD